jgi:tetratricopeptide (TPR) repeat protein
LQLAGDAERAYVEGRYAESVQLLDAFLAAQPAHAAAWLRKGNALHRLERQGDAAIAYRRALALTLDSAASAHWPEAAVVDMRSKVSANLAILGIEQAKLALDALGAVDKNPVAAAHRARIEAAMRAVIGLAGEAVPAGPAATLGSASHQGLPAAPSPLALAPAPGARQASSLPRPGAPLDDARLAPAASDPPLPRPAVEVIRGLVSR